MPVYEYRCRTCSHQFEIQQAFSDDALTDCPECSGDLRKVFAPVGITFKGSGFYKNDSRSGGSSSGGGAPGGSDSGSGDSSGDSSSAGSGSASSDAAASTTPSTTASTSSGSPSSD
jgi:putative FmdB family regulatory protein